jgi:hypothetical protein
LTWNNCVFQGKPCELPAALVALLDREHAFGRAFQLGLRIATSPDATAGHLYDELTRTGFDELMASPYRNSMLALLCASCARFDDRTRAKRLYQLLLPDAAQHVVPPGTWLYIAPVEECLAQLAVCLRDYDRAAAHFERAMEACEQLAARPHLARVQYQYARTLEASASRAPELADELHRRVKATSDKLGTAREWPLPAALRSVYKGES